MTVPACQRGYKERRMTRLAESIRKYELSKKITDRHEWKLADDFAYCKVCLVTVSDEVENDFICKTAVEKSSKNGYKRKNVFSRNYPTYGSLEKDLSMQVARAQI